VRAAVGVNGVTQLIIDYWAPFRPDEEHLGALAKFTVAQLEDGIGEGGFEIHADVGTVILYPDVEKGLSTELVEDGREVPAASAIAIAGRDGNIAALRRAIDLRGAVDADLQGYTGLQLAILYGHTDAACLLVANGADVNKPDPAGNSPLELCAVSNSLTDDGSAQIARLMLSAGADPLRRGPSGENAVTLADRRRKSRLVQTFAEWERARSG
jgi:hypothetical protein